ncbi:MAG: histidine kinase [Bacteroidetes bacterium CHB5]|nr:histidine kinase [Bacteroidetes bacterium CHB5]
MNLRPALGYKSWHNFYITYAIIFCLSFLGFLVRIIAVKTFTIGFQFRLFLISIPVVILSWEILRGINLLLDRLYPYSRNVAVRIILQLVLGTIFGLISRILIYYYGEPQIPTPVDELFMKLTWAGYMFFPTIVNMGFFIAYFLGKWKEELLKGERLEKEKAQVQFDNLKNQLNPHFLFNALASLNTLIAEDQQLASRFLQHLSKVYRYVLQHKEQNLVSLQTELDFIQNYIFMAETRFEQALSIRVVTQPGDLDKQLVPVTLQVLLENAFKHNVMEVSRPLCIQISTEGMHLVVRNNLQHRKQVEDSNQQGLENLNRLYQYQTGKPIQIETSSQYFTVKVPLL